MRKWSFDLLKCILACEGILWLESSCMVTIVRTDNDSCYNTVALIQFFIVKSPKAVTEMLVKKCYINLLQSCILLFPSVCSLSYSNSMAIVVAWVVYRANFVVSIHTPNNSCQLNNSSHSNASHAFEARAPNWTTFGFFQRLQAKLHPSAFLYLRI